MESYVDDNWHHGYIIFHFVVGFLPFSNIFQDHSIESYDYVDEKDDMAPVETKQIRWSDRRSKLETFGG